MSPNAVVDPVSTEVSVIIPLHNGARYIRESVLSVLAEELSSVEILVVDDASTDGGAALLTDLPVKLIRRSEKGGASLARNAALNEATGEYIAFLDADDRLVRGGLRSRLSWLRSHPGDTAVAGLVAGLIGAQGEPLNVPTHLIRDPQREPEGHGLTLDFFRRGGWIAHPLGVTLFRRKGIQQIGPFDPGLLRAQDLEFYLRWVSRFPVAVLFEPVLEYRIHGRNASIALGSEGILPSPLAQASGCLVRQQYGLRWVADGKKASAQGGTSFCLYRSSYASAEDLHVEGNVSSDGRVQPGA